MNPVQLSSLALIAFGVTEFFMRKGQAAKSFKRTAADKGTTPLIFGCYTLIVALFFLPTLPGPIAPRWLRCSAAGLAYGGLGYAGGQRQSLMVVTNDAAQQPV